jgi:hypothetical protein
MQLRRQDMDNKITTKRKIKQIKESKPKLISTPKKRWIPLKIEPKGAALNAKFYKGKPKPSIEFSRSDQESSAKRLRKLKKVHFYRLSLFFDLFLINSYRCILMILHLIEVKVIADGEKPEGIEEMPIITIGSPNEEIILKRLPVLTRKNWLKKRKIPFIPNHMLRMIKFLII